MSDIEEKNTQESNIVEAQNTVQDNSEKKGLGFGAGLGLGLGIGSLIIVIVIIVMTAKIVDLKKYDSQILDNDTKKKINVLYQVIQGSYYDYKDDEKSVEDIQNSLFKGMVDALDDPYSKYFTAEEIAEELLDAQGIYYGIGAYISVGDDGYPVFSGTIRNTPAEEAGIRAGDVIVFVDDESTYNMSLEDVVSRVKGEAGTSVHITIFREGEDDYIEMDVTRAAIESVSVAGEMLENHIGYIQIASFESGTASQFAYEYEQLKEKQLKGLIIDLRSNTGGLMNSVVDIASQILPEGVIVYEEDKNGVRKEYTCDGQNEINVPLVVLVNQYSASASEILTGAIKDYEIGTIVGTTTFGKGIVQTTKSLSDGSAVKLTVAAYFSPKGNNIQGKGIDPDVEVEFDADAYYNDGIDIQLNKAIEVLQGKMK